MMVEIKKPSQAARIADIKKRAAKLHMPAIKADPFGDDAEAERFDQQLQTAETAWAGIYEAVASGKSRIAHWDTCHRPERGSFMRYALHRSTKKPGYLQLSVMEIHGGDMLPMSDTQHSSLENFLQEVMCHSGSLEVTLR